MPHTVWQKLAVPLLVALLPLMFIALHPSAGSSLYGASRWIDLGPVTLQPSEFTKLAIVAFAATVLTKKWKRLDDPGHLLVPLAPVVVGVALIVILQRDLGTTVIICGSVFLLLFAAGVRLRYLAVTGAAALAATAFLIFGEAYRRTRFVDAFLNPWDDPDGAGFQLIQGMIAFGSGGWTGVGLGASRAKWDYLPNAHSDFIFAIVGEELGLLGALFVLAMFALLLFAGIRIAIAAPDTFGRLMAAGITGWIGLQTIINLGAVTGLLPITGVPLPLLSFGGTALVVTLAEHRRAGEHRQGQRAGGEHLERRAERRASDRHRRAGDARPRRTVVASAPEGRWREGQAMRVIMSGGGTAGHVFPALAVAERLRAAGHDVRFVGSASGQEAALVPAAGFPFVPVRGRAGTDQGVAALGEGALALARRGPHGASVGARVRRGRRHRRLRERSGDPRRTPHAHADRVDRAERRAGHGEPARGALGARGGHHLRGHGRSAPGRHAHRAHRQPGPPRDRRGRRFAGATTARGARACSTSRTHVARSRCSEGARVPGALDRTVAAAIERLRDRDDLQLLVATGPAHVEEVAPAARESGDLLVRVVGFIDRIDLALAAADLAVARAGVGHRSPS